jgi:hypothetical protein
MTYLLFWFMLVRPAPIIHPLPRPVVIYHIDPQPSRSLSR